MSTKIVALWKTPEDAEGFEQHYAATHLPLARSLPGIENVIVTKALNGPYYRMTELVFANAEALGPAFGSPEAAKLMEDTGHIQETFKTTCDVLTVEDE